MRHETSVSDLARYALGAVRLVNGGLCLLTPARAAAISALNVTLSAVALRTAGARLG